MRRALGGVLTFFGVLLLTLGGIGVVVVGPDDTVVVGTKEVPERAAGMAVRTHPALTGFTNMDLQVRAEAEGGVFLASSHRVDTEDMLEGLSYYEITRVAVGDVGGVVVEDGPRATRRALRPTQLVGWLSSTSGETSAELEVPLTSTPLDVVAVPQRGDARVTFTLGVHVTGAFAALLACALVGTGLLVASRRVLRRPGGAEPPSQRASRQRPARGSRPARRGEDETTDVDEAFPRRAPARVRRDARRRVPALVLLPVALLAQSCALPAPASTDGGAATRQGIRLHEAREVHPDTQVVFSPQFSAYPVWALAGSASPNRLRVMSRASFTAPWRTEARVRIGGSLPTPVEKAVDPNDILLRRADEAAEAISTWWSTGEVGTIVPDAATQRRRAQLLATGVDPGSVWAMRPVGASYVRMVEVAGGHLVVVRHTVRTPQAWDLTTVLLFPASTGPEMLGSTLVEATS